MHNAEAAGHSLNKKNMCYGFFFLTFSLFSPRRKKRLLDSTDLDPDQVKAALTEFEAMLRQFHPGKNFLMISTSKLFSAREAATVNLESQMRHISSGLLPFTLKSEETFETNTCLLDAREIAQLDYIEESHLRARIVSKPSVSHYVLPVSIAMLGDVEAFKHPVFDTLTEVRDYKNLNRLLNESELRVSIQKQIPGSRCYIGISEGTASLGPLLKDMTALILDGERLGKEKRKARP